MWDGCMGAWVSVACMATKCLLMDASATCLCNTHKQRSAVPGHSIAGPPARHSTSASLCHARLYALFNKQHCVHFTHTCPLLVCMH